MDIPIAFILDIDGVITDPVEKKVTETEIIDSLAEQLNHGNFVAFNTGRSTQWAINNVFPLLYERISNTTVLSNLFIVGEKGGTWAEFKDGDWHHSKDPDLSIPEDLRSKAIEETSHKPFNDIGGELDPKGSMYSFEMVDGMDIAQYQAQSEPLIHRFKALIREAGLEDKFKVDATTIAIDIENRHVGKHLGTRRVLDWLKSKNVTPQHFITVGDSESDLEMADELFSQGKTVDFYYVNPNKPLNTHQPYPVIATKGRFGKGTIEMFKKIADKMSS